MIGGVSNGSTAFIPLLLDAVAHQEAGRFEQASVGYAAVLALEPEQPQALLFGGVLAMHTGNAEEAVSLLERAVAARPTHAEGHFALANALWAAGRRGVARATWQHTLRHERHHVGALLNLARAQEEAGEAELAVGNCRTAVAARPDHPRPLAALASTLRACGQGPEALEAADAALRLDPYFAHAHHQRGMALKLLGRTAEAAGALQRAIQLAPSDGPSHLNLANILHDLGDIAGAERHCRIAIAIDPAMAEAHAVLGLLMTQTGDIGAAIAACNEAIRLNPAMSEAHCNLGIALLTAGDLPGGFARYEWRKRHPVYGKQFFSLPDPEWLGEPLAGKRVVIMAEQGLGDAIMFARYAAVLAERGAEVMIACDRRLVPLLQHAPGVTEAIPKSRTMPSFDLWVDQMSLPLLCKTTVETVPCAGPYLAADPTRTAAWSHQLAFPSGLKRVGLVWAGNPLHNNDANRSCPTETFAEIARLPGIAAASLQVGARAADAAALGLRDLSPLLTDYAETAALVANLDLVITVDTSVAHLAAAMGKPTWIMLPHCPEWRWMRERGDSPWYSCVRLFRQERPGDWDSVRAAILTELTSIS